MRLLEHWLNVVFNWKRKAKLAEPRPDLPCGAFLGPLLGHTLQGQTEFFIFFCEVFQNSDLDKATHNRQLSNKPNSSVCTGSVSSPSCAEFHLPFEP